MYVFVSTVMVKSLLRWLCPSSRSIEANVRGKTFTTGHFKLLLSDLDFLTYLDVFVSYNSVISAFKWPSLQFSSSYRWQPVSEIYTKAVSPRSNSVKSVRHCSVSKNLQLCRPQSQLHNILTTKVTISDHFHWLHVYFVTF